MGRPYTGNADAPGKGERPGLSTFIANAKFIWGFKNLGTFTVRLMRSAPAGLKEGSADWKKWVSVHATGRAVDLGWSDRTKALEFLAFIEKYADQLGIEEIHDYFYTGPAGQWGRGWRCDRAAWKIYDANSNAGTPGGQWIHIELSPQFADNPALVTKAFTETIEKAKRDAKVAAYLKSLAEAAKKEAAEEDKKKSKEQKAKERKNAEAAAKHVKEVK